MIEKLYIEPLGFLFGDEARLMVASGNAYSFGREDVAFSMARLLSSHGMENIVPITQLTSPWKELAEELGRPFPTADLPKNPLIMGILNVTPDSFSDGGKYLQLKDAICLGHQMVNDGASIIDIGGESTRPGSRPVPIEEECNRVIPVIKALQGCGAKLSIDTRHTVTMRCALEAGVDIINDISALRDEGSAELVAQANCPIILMHMRGTPQDMEQKSTYQHIVLEVLQELDKRIEYALNVGIKREKIIIDPGIGFAKDINHNIELLRHLPIFANLRCRLLIGVSRKRFIRSLIQENDPSASDVGTIIASLPALLLDGSLIRVHNVAAMRQALQMQKVLRFN